MAAHGDTEMATLQQVLGARNLIRVIQAVKPGIPITPKAVETGARTGSSFCNEFAAATAYSCQPVWPRTTSPGT